MKSENKSLSMVLCSCDNYEDAWAPFCSQLTKYWPEFKLPIYLGAESKTFSFPGLDIRCPLAEGPIHKQWSKRLSKLLERIDSEFILFMLDDFWLTSNVDTASFNKMFSYLKDNSNIGFICLRHEKHEYAPEEKQFAVECEFPELIECLHGRSFRITTQAGLWRRKYLLKLLRNHESPWLFETRANWRSQFFKERIFDVKNTILEYPVGGFFGAGKCYRDYVPLFDENIIHECIEKRGLINFGDEREYPDSNKGFAYYWGKFRSALPKI